MADMLAQLNASGVSSALAGAGMTCSQRHADKHACRPSQTACRTSPPGRLVTAGSSQSHSALTTSCAGSQDSQQP